MTVAVTLGSEGRKERHWEAVTLWCEDKQAPHPYERQDLTEDVPLTWRGLL